MNNTMPTPPITGSAQPRPHDASELAQRLGTLMDELVDSYSSLVELARERETAIRTSDAQRLAGCIRRENAIVQRIAELDRQRGEVVDAIAPMLGSQHGAATRVSWVAERIGGAERERLRVLIARLREVTATLTALNEVCRVAAEALASHMTGLLHAVARHLNHAKTYSRGGRVEAGARVVSSLDIST